VLSAGAAEAAASGLVVFSPLPPARSGVADYTAELLPALGRRAQVTVVVASERDPRPVDGATVVSEVEYRRRSGLHGLPHLYQLGNSLHGAEVYRQALRRPGVVLLHDTVLHHLVEALTVERGDWLGYETVMAENGGVQRRSGTRGRGRGQTSAGRPGVPARARRRGARHAPARTDIRRVGGADPGIGARVEFHGALAIKGVTAPAQNLQLNDIWLTYTKCAILRWRRLAAAPCSSRSSHRYLGERQRRYGFIRA
jgi:hypothetical protein